MTVTPEQQEEIDRLRADARPTLRAVSEGMERHAAREAAGVRGAAMDPASDGECE